MNNEQKLVFENYIQKGMSNGVIDENLLRALVPFPNTQILSGSGDFEVVSTHPELGTFNMKNGIIEWMD